MSSTGYDTNFGLAQRARDERTAGMLNGTLDPFMAAQSNYAGPGWDAFFQGQKENEQAAKGAGMNYRVNWGGLDNSIGGGGAYSPADARTIGVNEALGSDTQRFRLGQAAITAAQAQSQAMIDAAAERNRAQIAAESDSAAIDNAMSPARPIMRAEGGRPGDTPTFADGAAPPAPTRAEILAALPGHLQPSVAALFNQQDTAALTNAGLAAKTNLENAQAKAALAKAQADANPFGGTSGIDQTKTGDAFLQTLSPAIQKQVQMLAGGKMPFPSSIALKTPYWQGILQAVGQYDPSFDSAQASNNARVKVRQDFTSGKSATSINAINTAIGHLSKFSDVVDQLDNGASDTWTGVKNALTPGGSKRGVALNDFNTLKNGISSELTRVWRQAGGSEQDIKDWGSTIGDTKSKAELHGALSTIGDMLESKLGSLQDQYKQGMGTNDINVIAPFARQSLDKLEGRAGGPAAGAPAAGGPGAAPQQRPIPGIAGGVAELQGGRWVRVR